MCVVSRRRMEWYLSRKLAEIVSIDPPVFKLKFKPGGNGNANDPSGPMVRENRCVVCGNHESLTRHHVVPRCFRKHLPSRYKDRNCRDVLMLCITHHDEYESKAEELRDKLSEEYGVSLDDDPLVEDFEATRAWKALHALDNYSDDIPARRIKILRAELRAYLKSSGLSEHDIRGMGSKSYKPEGWMPGSERLMVEVGTSRIEHFIERWRSHFVTSMNPRFLPADWQGKHTST